MLHEHFHAGGHSNNAMLQTKFLTKCEFSHKSVVEATILAEWLQPHPMIQEADRVLVLHCVKKQTHAWIEAAKLNLSQWKFLQQSKNLKNHC